MSDDAIISEAQIPTNESGPYFVIISSNVAIEALPENGRKIISGKSSLGMPILSKNGDKNVAIAFSAPDEINIETETTRAQIDGKSPIEPLKPDFAPFKKLEK